MCRNCYEGVLGQYGDKRMNEINMIFAYKQIHTYTWARTEGKSMIDLFRVDQRIRNQVIDT